MNPEKSCLSWRKCRLYTAYVVSTKKGVWRYMNCNSSAKRWSRSKSKFHMVGGETPRYHCIASLWIFQKSPGRICKGSNLIWSSWSTLWKTHIFAYFQNKTNKVNMLKTQHDKTSNAAGAAGELFPPSVEHRPGVKVRLKPCSWSLTSITWLVWPTLCMHTYIQIYANTI